MNVPKSFLNLEPHFGKFTLNPIQDDGDGVCIPLYGNIPLGGNNFFAACIVMLEEKNIEND